MDLEESKPRKKRPLPYIASGTFDLLDNIFEPNPNLKNTSKRAKHNPATAVTLSVPTRSTVIHRFGKAKAVAFVKSDILGFSEQDIQLSLHWAESDTTELGKWYTGLSAANFAPKSLEMTSNTNEMEIYYTIPKSYEPRVAQEVRQNLLVPGTKVTAFLKANQQEFSFVISRLQQSTAQRQHSGVMFILAAESSGNVSAQPANFFKKPAPRREIRKNAFGIHL